MNQHGAASFQMAQDIPKRPNCPTEENHLMFKGMYPSQRLPICPRDQSFFKLLNILAQLF